MLKRKIKDLYNHYQKIILIATISLFIGGITFYWVCSNLSRDSNDSESSSTIIPKVIAKASDSRGETKEYFYVDIKGAVTSPGVYKVENGNRIIDVIKLAGGLTKVADTSVLNLSKKINDEMSIIIYTKNQIKQFKNSGLSTNETIIKYIEKECTCPDPSTNDACISDNSNQDDTTTQNDTATTGVSINTGTLVQLQTLPGIGESKAQAIIDYRNVNGSFKTIDEIKNVSGIGDSTFAKIKDYITI